MAARVLFIFIASLWALQIQAQFSGDFNALANKPDLLLAYAVNTGDMAALHESIRLGVQVKAHSNLLFLAVKANNLPAAEVLLQCGAAADVKAKGPHPGAFVTPLMLAAQSGFFEMAQLLIIYGANVSYVSREMEIEGRQLTHQPLAIALIYGHDKVANLLVEYGAALGANESAYIKQLRSDQWRYDLFKHTAIGVAGAWLAWNLLPCYASAPSRRVGPRRRG